MHRPAIEDRHLRRVGRLAVILRRSNRQSEKTKRELFRPARRRPRRWDQKFPSARLKRSGKDQPRLFPPTPRANGPSAKRRDIFARPHSTADPEPPGTTALDFEIAC